ncbi:recombinase family protein [Streptomyces sp. NPDC056160]|uniref:recombinase family protein n=1 Tax=Streptomyces sp. NPDC056160 TaxID=3345731 RepID=UPI0035DA636C
MNDVHTHGQSELLHVASYARTSGDFRQRDGHGVRRQLRINERTAHEYGCRVVATYVDNGRTASKEGVVRPGFDRLLEDLVRGRTAEGGNVHGVVCVAERSPGTGATSASQEPGAAGPMRRPSRSGLPDAKAGGAPLHGTWPLASCAAVRNGPMARCAAAPCVRRRAGAAGARTSTRAGPVSGAASVVHWRMRPLSDSCSPAHRQGRA